MSLALYRRYRPDSFEEVVGQEHVTLPLQQALRNGRVNHAYLFSGPRGCGKTTSARILARCLNCEQGPTPTPCGVCRSCTELASGGPGSIDVIEIDAASHGGVDDARDLRERAFFAPAASRFKIYIIDEAHMVTSAGFNALLKVVEEPPPHLKFIFATTEPEKVIGTIRSRTHHYPFRLIPPGVLRDHLADITAREGIKVEPEVLPLVVRAGAGSARDAMSVMDQLLAGADENGVSYAMAIGLLGYTDAALLDQLTEAFAARDGAAVFRMVDQVVESGHDPRRFLADLLERFRDLVILNAVTDADAARSLIDVPDDQFERMAAQARAFGAAELSRAADLVNTGLTEMRGATAPRLLLELVCARVMLPGADDAERGLAARLDRIERRGAVAAAPAPMAPMSGPRVVADEFDEAPVARPSAPAPVAEAAPAGGNTLGVPPWAAEGASGGSAGGNESGAENGGLLAARPRQQAGGGAAENGGSLGVPPWAAEGNSVSAPSRQQTGSGEGALGTPPWQADSSQGPAVPEPAPQPAPIPHQQPTAPPAPAPAPAAAGASADARRMWPDLVEEVKRRDGRVSWMLLSQNAQLLGLDGDRLQVAFINAGARNSFTSRGTADTLRQAAADLFGVQWQVDALVDPSQTPGTVVAPGVMMAPPPSQNQNTPPPQPRPQPPAPQPESPAPAQSPAQSPAPAAPQKQPPQAQAPAPPPTPTIRPEDDVPSEDDEEVEEDNATAHELVIRELGAQRLDPES